MSVYAGLDISLDAVAICVIAETGEMLWQGKVLGDPDAVTAALQRWRDDLVRVGGSRCDIGVDRRTPGRRGLPCRVFRESTCQSGSGRDDGEDGPE